jgi:hypothetical protein
MVHAQIARPAAHIDHSRRPHVQLAQSIDGAGAKQFGLRPGDERTGGDEQLYSHK